MLKIEITEGETGWRVNARLETISSSNIIATANRVEHYCTNWDDVINTLDRIKEDEEKRADRITVKLGRLA